MPVSIVIGGQFGSEGKGKTALEIVRRSEEPVVAIRVGGPNSGHTAYDCLGSKRVLRQLPAACVDRNVDVVLPAGSFIDVDVLLEEIEALDYPRNRIRISGYARLVQREHREWEKATGLTRDIGSTGSGVGGAVMATVARGAANFHLPSQAASDEARLQCFIDDDTSHCLRRHIERGGRAVIEGTQGFGLSLIEGGYWPKATSRSTTAYEGRIGDIVYQFDENAALVKIPTNPLIVKANSIVFVESDIDFRLPDFIALRFNLQIRHVHRGLLLGTGRHASRAGK